MSTIMSQDRTWILVVAAVATAVLAIIGSQMYPIRDMGVLWGIGYVVAVVLCALGLLLLIFKKGLPGT